MLIFLGVVVIGYIQIFVLLKKYFLFLINSIL